MDIGVKRIVVYVAVTFAISWAYEFAVVYPLALGGEQLGSSVVLQFTIGAVMFVPALGVLITRLVTKEGFAGTLIKPVRFRKTWKYWLAGYFGPTLLIALGAVAYFALFPGEFDPGFSYLKSMLEAQTAGTGFTFTQEQLAMLVAIQLAFAAFAAPVLNILPCFGEEWGWRGYLLPKLSERMRIVPTLFISGVIWGLWHAPITALGHNYGTDYPGWPVVGILAMCAFCTVVGVFLSYLTLRSGSCVPAALAHGALNGCASASMLFTATGGNPFVGPVPTGIVGGVGFIAVAIVLAVRLERRQRRGEPLLTVKEDVR